MTQQTNITIGHDSDGDPVELDPSAIVSTRLMIQADDIEAVLGYVAALEEEVADHLAVIVLSDSVWSEADPDWRDCSDPEAGEDFDITDLADRLVALNRWERHPTRPGLYRPKPDHFPDAGEKVGEARP